jgi:hypothetical protein
MKHISLTRAARVNGELRLPHDGVQLVTDEEAERLISEDSATDVSDDFAEKKEKSK